LSAAEEGTSNEALELARRAFELFNAREMEAFWSLQHPEIVMATAPMWPGGGTYEGIAGFRRFLDQFLDAFSEVRFEHLREPEAVGELALFRGRWVGSGASTGIETASIEFSVLFGTREGLVDQARFFVEDEDARRFATELSQLGRPAQ
jgi:SnoaL-like domain